MLYICLSKLKQAQAKTSSSSQHYPESIYSILRQVALVSKLHIHKHINELRIIFHGGIFRLLKTEHTQVWGKIRYKNRA